MQIEEITKIVKEVLSQQLKIDKKIPIESSAKHVHLSKEDVEKLFGVGYELKIKRELSQPGQFLAQERVKIIGPKGGFENVAVLGPVRKKTQVEVSISDARSLGIKPVLKESGNLDGASDLYIQNGENIIKTPACAIVAKRHIHMNEEDARKLNLSDGQIVRVKTNTIRPVIFEDVLVRINSNYRLSMHIDFDESNSCDLQKDSWGEIYE